MKRRGLAKLIAPGVVFVIVVLGWELVSQALFRDKDYILPSPAEVAQSIGTHFPQLFAALFITFREAAIGFVVSAVVAIVLGLVMSESRLVEHSLYPYAVFFQTVPVLAIAPIIVLWFHYGETSVIIVSAIISFFPVLVSTIVGLRATEPIYEELFSIHGATTRMRLIKLKLPGASPSIFGGLRIAAGASVVGAIVGEFLIGSGGQSGGLGVQILLTQAQLNTGLLFAAALFATVLGMAFFLGVGAASYAFLHKWHASARTE